MGWLFRDKTPDGTPVAEWDVYEFNPQPDITTYELALVVAMYGDAGQITRNVFVSRKNPHWADLENAKRHFSYLREMTGDDLL